MECVEISAPGAPSVLVPARRPVPVPAAGEVLVQVAAAGVNRPDVLQRLGQYPVPPGASDLPGLEVAGTVAALGQGVTWPVVGDQVCALVPGGGYAQYCVTPAVQCLPIPAGMDMVMAAGIPETFFTVWFNLFMQADARQVGSILVHGGSSGIGTTAIQLAAHFGVRVFTTVGSVAKAKACLELGAELAINYHEEDFVAKVNEAMGGAGVDMVLDMVGGPYCQRDVAVLAPKGRLVLIAFLGGSKAEFDFMPVLRKNLVITGSTMRPQPVAVKERVAAGLREEVWPLLAAGVVRPLVHATFPLSEAYKAHEMMEQSSQIGKIILCDVQFPKVN